MTATAQLHNVEGVIGSRETASITTGTHSLIVGYVLWIFGVFGAHRFYFGKPISGTIYFFTLGLLGIGWILDLFLIPSMHSEAEWRYPAGHYDYNAAWVLLTFFGLLGVHRLYLGKWITGLLMLLVAMASSVVFPLGLIVLMIYLYDYWTLNEQVAEVNAAVR